MIRSYYGDSTLLIFSTLVNVEKYNCTAKICVKFNANSNKEAIAQPRNIIAFHLRVAQTMWKNCENDEKKL